MATIKSVIDMADRIKPSIFDNATKTAWINECEGYIQTEVFLLAVDDVAQYKYSDTIAASVYFPDNKTMVFAESPKLYIGGQIKISGLSAYSANNSNTNRRILDVSSDGKTLTFADNSFSATGTAAENGTVTYDGSETELMVSKPHDKLYYAYLCAMIDFAHGEYTKYETSMAMYNARLTEFIRWFASRYDPAGRN